MPAAGLRCIPSLTLKDVIKSLLAFVLRAADQASFLRHSGEFTNRTNLAAMGETGLGIADFASRNEKTARRKPPGGKF